MSFVRHLYQSTQYYGQYSLSTTPPKSWVTTVKVGQNIGNRVAAQLWATAKSWTLPLVRKTTFSNWLFYFFLVQERICYAEAQLHWSLTAFTATQHARIYNHIRVWLQDMTWIWSCIAMNHELLYSLCSSLIRKQSRIVCRLELQLQQVAHISSDSLFQDMNTEGN